MRTLVCVLFLLFCLWCNGQKWALSSSRWLCSYSWNSPPSGYTASVEKDTLIDNTLCKKIGFRIYSYESGDTVYFYFNGRFRPTYYFNAHIGDTISYYNYTSLCTESDSVFRAIVANVDTLQLSGQYLKRFRTVIVPSITGHVLYDTVVTYIEKIGSNYIYPFFYFNCIIDGDMYGTCNYGDSTISDFYIYPNRNCLTGVSEVADKKFGISPNPSSNFVTISIDKSNINTDLSITDLTGSVVVQTQLTIINTQLSTQNLPNGLYFVSLKHNNVVSTQKLLIQR